MADGVAKGIIHFINYAMHFHQSYPQCIYMRWG